MAIVTADEREREQQQGAQCAERRVGPANPLPHTHTHTHTPDCSSRKL